MVVEPERETANHGADEESILGQKKSVDGSDAGEDVGVFQSPSKISLDFLSCVGSNQSLDRFSAWKSDLERNPAPFLGEFDLRLELQNYFKASDAFGSKTVTKITLQRFFHLEEENSDKYYEMDDTSAKEEGLQPPDFEGTFWDDAESLIGSSYQSATSFSFEGNPNSAHVNLNKNRERDMQGDQSGVPGRKFTSQTKLHFGDTPEKMESMRKIKSENDRKKLEQEIRCRNFARRILAKPSAQLLRVEERESFSAPQRNLLQDSGCGILFDTYNSYEKISPLETLPFGSGNFFYENLFKSDNFLKPRLKPKTSSKLFEFPKKEKPDERISSRSKGQRNLGPTKFGNLADGILGSKHKWSPTLPELIELYNSVLKEKEKNARESTARMLPKAFFPFFRSETTEKQRELASLSAVLRKKFEMCNDWESTVQRSEGQELHEYVSIFQEILAASLTSKQITRLNSLMAELEDYLARNYDAMKQLKVTTIPKEEINERWSSGSKKAANELKSKSFRKETETTVSRKSVREKSSKFWEGENSRDETTCENVNMELMVPANLKSVLRSCFKSSKILWKVRLGEKVTRMPQLQNQSSLPRAGADTIPLHQTKSSGTCGKAKQLVSFDKNGQRLLNVEKTSTKKSRGRKAGEKSHKKKIGKKKTENEKTPNWCLAENITEPFSQRNGNNQVRYDRLAAENPAFWEYKESLITAETQKLGEPANYNLSKDRSYMTGKTSMASQATGSKKSFQIDSSFKRKWSCSSGKQKSRVILQKKPLTSYLSYSFLLTSQDKSIARKKMAYNKAKANIRYPKPCVRTKKFEKSLNKELKDCGKLQVEHAVCSEQQNEDPLKGRNNPTGNDRMAKGTPTNTILFLNHQDAPDCCSVEFFFKGNGENGSGNTSSRALSWETHEIALKIQHDDDPESEGGSRPPGYQTRSIRESPIFIHKVSSKKSGDVSFPTLAIHSDSFLQSRSSLTISKSKLESLLRSSSETKFYPGKVTDKLEDQKPFVTFVLTPRQKAGLDIFSNQVKMVERNRRDNIEWGTSRGNHEKPELEARHSLKSIEKFIELLSKAPRKRKRQDKDKAGDKKFWQGIKNQKLKKLLNRPNIKSSTRPPKEKPIIQLKPREYRNRFVRKTISGNTAKNQRDFWPKIEDENTNAKNQTENEKNSRENQRENEENSRENQTENEERSRENQTETWRKPENEKNWTEDIKNKAEEKLLMTPLPETEEKETKRSKLMKTTQGSGCPSKIISKNIPIDGDLIPDLVKFLEKVLNAKASFRSKQRVFESLREYLKDLNEETKKKLEEDDEKEEREIKSTKIDELSELLEEEEIPEKKMTDQDKSLTPPETPTTSGVKKVKEYKIKIYCNNAQALSSKYSKKRKASQQPRGAMKEAKSEFQPFSGSEVEGPKDVRRFLEILVSREGEMKRNSSIYYDAEGEVKEESFWDFAKMVGNLLPEQNNLPSKGTNTCVPDEDVSPETLTLSDASPHSSSQLSADSEKDLISNHVFYSLILLESFLKKAKNANTEEIIDSTRIHDMLKTVENKSKNLMICLEEKGWVKVLSLLEDICEVPKKRGAVVEDEKQLLEYLKNLKDRLNLTKSLIKKIQNLKIQRLSKGASFSFAQPSPSSSDHNPPAKPFLKAGGVFSKTREAFESLKMKIFSVKSQKTLNGSLEKMRKNEDDSINKESTEILSEKKSSAEDSTTNSVEENKKRLLQKLKKEIGQQTFYAQYLIDADYAPQIQTTKTKIADKLKALQEIVSNLCRKYSDEEVQKKPQGTAVSLLNLIRAYASFLRRTREREGENQMGSSLQGPSFLDGSTFDDYSNLLRLLVKVWDTRSSFGSLSSKSHTD